MRSLCVAVFFWPMMYALVLRCHFPVVISILILITSILKINNIHIY